MASDQSLSPVGFIGLGRMGSVMARHILASGRKVIGWDRSPEALATFELGGGTAPAKIAEIGIAPVVISIVFDDAGTREIALGENGLVNTMAPGSTHIVMASISPAMSRTLAEAHAARGQHYLAASVFGRPEAAQARQLIINCSGSPEGFDAAKPVLEVLGRPQWVGSEPEQAMLVKTVGNSMIYASIEMLREMFAFLRAGGIEEQKAKEILVDTLFPGMIFSGYAQRYIDDPELTRMTAIAYKDRQNCLDAARAMGVDLPLMQFMSDAKLP